MNGCKVRNNYKNEDEKKRRYGIMKYVCDLCGWEYDEEQGYPEGGIAPGTKWEEVAWNRLSNHDLYPEKVDNR